jgi:hypothetical protein
MAGRGPAPKPAAERRNRAAKARGEVASTPTVGWRFGPVPAPPTGLLKVSRESWGIWMGSWVAAHWELLDLPGLFLLIKLYDQVQRGAYQRSAELRIQMDTYGLTPKGQQDRRWKAPEVEAPERAAGARGSSRYGHLRAVPESKTPAKRAARARKAPGKRRSSK